MTDKRMALVPREATTEMVLAAMEAKVAASIATDGPIPRMPKRPDKASYSDGFDRGMRWGAQTISSVEMEPAVNAAIIAAPNGGRVSLEQARTVRTAILDPGRFVGPSKEGEFETQWQARAVITALGLEIEE